jgi:hypothetical protein
LTLCLCGGVHCCPVAASHCNKDCLHRVASARLTFLVVIDFFAQTSRPRSGSKSLVTGSSTAAVSLAFAFCLPSPAALSAGGPVSFSCSLCAGAVLVVVPCSREGDLFAAWRPFAVWTALSSRIPCHLLLMCLYTSAVKSDFGFFFCRSQRNLLAARVRVRAVRRPQRGSKRRRQRRAASPQDEL